MDRVLVLNADYSPLNVTSVRHGFKLVYKGKAEVLRALEQAPLIAGAVQYARPVIIRLLKYVRFVMKRLKVNRRRVYDRDHHACAYCGSSKHLTIDHIIPKSKGGSNTWTNLITCCYSCNLKKADRTPEEAGMKLNAKPYEPSVFGKLFDPDIEQVWSDYQLSFGV